MIGVSTKSAKVLKGGAWSDIERGEQSQSYGPRLLALIDILGFRTLISSLGAEEVGRRYSAALTHSGEGWSDIFPPFRTGDRAISDFADVTAFSDTTVILSHSDDDQDVIRAYYAVWRLTQLLTIQGFPVRGAVCYGDVFAGAGGRAMVSAALVEADALEKAQEWIGVCVSDPAFDRISQAVQNHPDLKEFAERALVKYAVPTKSRCEVRYCVNWRANVQVDVGLKSFLRDELAVSEPKLAHTIAFLEWIVASGNKIWFNEIPVVAGGKTPPPYPDDDL